MIIIQRCSRCGFKNRYEAENWAGREETDCLKCHLPLTVCSGYVYSLMNEEEIDKFLGICSKGGIKNKNSKHQIQPA